MESRHEDRKAPRSTLTGALRAVLPFTGRGLALSVVAGGLLSAGLARADLAALFWGASFLLYAAYALAASHVCVFLLKRALKARPDFLSVILPPEGLAPGDQGAASIAARLPRVLAPGFAARFDLPLSWHERSGPPISCRLGPGRTEREMPFRAARRGTYRSREAMLEVRDVLGFSVSRVSVPAVETLVVHPTVASGQSWQMLAEGEDQAAVTRRRRRSEELLEVRKYYPGDDARRLNWKVFAHSRELFLRVGEETPPPESRLLFVLDTTENPLIPRPLRDAYLDGLVDSCASAMDALIRDRICVLLCRPGAADCRAFVLEERAQLLACLADQWWTDQPWLPSLPAERHLHAAVFSTPGSPGLGRILARIRDRGWSTSLFLKSPPGSGVSPAPRLRDLLFVPEGPKDGGRTGRSLLKARSALAEELTRDLAAYGSPAWKVRHAREV